MEDKELLSVMIEVELRGAEDVVLVREVRPFYVLVEFVHVLFLNEFGFFFEHKSEFLIAAEVEVLAQADQLLQESDQRLDDHELASPRVDHTLHELSHNYIPDDIGVHLVECNQLFSDGDVVFKVETG